MALLRKPSEKTLSLADMLIGCHTSVAKDIRLAPLRAAKLGCEAMQIFSRPPQGGKAPVISRRLADDFKRACQQANIRAVYLHTPYFINLASPNNRIKYGSVKVIREELERASLLGAKYVITHLGSARGHSSKKEALREVAQMLIKSLDGYQGKAKLLLENSAGAGEIIGKSLADLSWLLETTSLQPIAGICLDTQHSFASGYDWRQFAQVRRQLSKETKEQNIKLIHLNDSAVAVGSCRDRHAHLGEGQIDLAALEQIVCWAKKLNIDLICETKLGGVAADIKKAKQMRNLCK